MVRGMTLDEPLAALLDLNGQQADAQIIDTGHAPAAKQ